MSEAANGYGVRMRSPVNTYRLQITAGFDLFAAAEVLPYLHDLGVDWVYLSPLLEAEPGSDHGYDVVAHDRVDPARGGAEGLAAVSAEARRLGLGVLVDIVPNHVGIATPHVNAGWWDLLTHGRSSRYAAAFDVDWDAGGGRVRIPVVGDDDVLPGGRIGHLAVVGDELHYFDHRFPLAPSSADELSSVAGDPSVVERSRDHLDPDQVHARQHYELVSWRVADSGLNYRRFFAVNSLAGIRVEDRAVFDESHVEIRRWFDEGLVDGLRVDHPDGLRDPASYLDDLAGLTGGAYVLVEKILEPGERLDPAWATAGTTGYDALGLIDRVLTDPAGEAPLTALEARLHGRPFDWPELIHGTKRAVADGILNSEVRRVVREAGVATSTDAHSVVERSRDHDDPSVVERSRDHDDPSVVERSRDHDDPSVVERSRDHDDPSVVERSRDHASLVDAVAELVACFPVYRSYLPDGHEHLAHALADAGRRRPDLADALDVLAPILGDADHPAALRFQQTTGAVMAKGVEDCAFYRTSRLTSLTEVGGDPSEFSFTVEEFHTAMAERQRDWPQAMTTTSTHDTKRGEDVRARITVLAELPDVWAETLDRLLELAPLPDPGFGNLLWQSVVGAWPASRERLHGYAEKAMREAGDRTTWTEPDADYEQAVHGAVDAAYDDGEVRSVLDGIVARISGPGWSNSLSAKVVALTMPGVPDVYQGSELWEQSLVDPDNRRPVDFARRTQMLPFAPDANDGPATTSPNDDGLTKLLVTSTALTARRDGARHFTTYRPLNARGTAADHVLAFDRGSAITVVTRLPLGLEARGGWGDTELDLPDGRWIESVTGREVGPRLDDILAVHPVALLVLDDPVGEGVE
ncbi:malto-oligosyltrehalose synthase [Nocardioides cynanchi]|uniref:malto-oligosyltrehalose synthase n=1 Tax=Nocardioides cynanchi TaxID=2558918 RepID=UPI001EE2ACD1|nr:malto-oligosyltrehalose synthase [Nocardioides cynanchi]